MAIFDYTGIHHSAFATADMEQTIAYWRDLLGFRLSITYANKDGRQYAFSLGNHSLIYFFEWPDVTAVSPKRHGSPVAGPFTFDHLAIGLGSKQGLFRLQDRLVENDFPVTDVMDHGYIYSIYSFDPNGIPLEFNCPADIPVDLDAHPVLADPSPASAARLGTRPVPGKWKEPELDQTERPIIPGEDRDIFDAPPDPRSF